MTEIETLKSQIKMLEKKLSFLEELEKQKLLPKMKLNQTGSIDDLEYNGLRYFRIDFNDYSDYSDYFYPIWWEQTERHHAKMQIVADKETREHLEFDYNNLVKSKPAEEVFDRLEDKYKEAEENSASYITDDVVDRLVKEYKAQKLYNRLFEIGYDKEDCNIILSVVEDWIPEPQSSYGSQNVNTELLVDGFNDAILKMKEMLR